IEPSSNLPENVCDGCLKNLDDILCFINQSKDNDANLRKILKEWETKLYYDDDSSDSAGADDSTEPYVKPEADDSKNDSDDCEGSTKSDKEACTPAEFVKLESNHKGGEKKKVNRKRTPKKRVSKRQPSNCEICGESFRTKGLLAEHQKQNVVCRTKPFKCARCDMAFNRKFRLNLHMRSHTKETPFECKICSRKFTLCSNLKRHEDIVHKGLRPFKCDICGKVLTVYSVIALYSAGEGKPSAYTSLMQKDDHVRTHTGERPYLCSYCGKSFGNYSHHLAHIHRHKKKDKEKEKRVQDEPTFNCDLCSEFARNTNLAEHRRDHSQEIPFICSYCGLSFKKSAPYRYHLNLHKVSNSEKGSEDLICKICRKVFGSKASFINHQAVHDNEKAFLCDMCGKNFRKKQTLGNHIRVHLGIKTFNCRFCERTFSRKSTLDVHILSHTKEKPYTCDICLKKFAQEVHLKNHSRIHSGEKPYKCSYCNKKFSVKCNLVIHTRMHTNDATYKCTVCEKIFYESRSLKKHMKVHQDSSLIVLTNEDITTLLS
ncbi:hypothetical protein NQ318_021034, partial [Aromia moschata]